MYESFRSSGLDPEGTGFPQSLEFNFFKSLLLDSSDGTFVSTYPFSLSCIKDGPKDVSVVILFSNISDTLADERLNHLLRINRCTSPILCQM